jgi:hypothetical protein
MGNHDSYSDSGGPEVVTVLRGAVVNLRSLDFTRTSPGKSIFNLVNKASTVSYSQGCGIRKPQLPRSEVKGRDRNLP